MFENPQPGLFVVRYRSPGDMDPERQAHLVDAIRAASRAQRVAIVFVIGDALTRVDFAVPAFWIKVTGDPAIRIAAMAMVTDSKAVEIAAHSFGAASRFRRVSIDVQTFPDELSAASWARRVLAAPPPARA
jgi:hypothetical protein